MADLNNNNGPQSGENGMSDLLSSIVPDMLAVIMRPVQFFQQMPRQGGFVPPLLFMTAMALLTALITAILSVFGMGAAAMMGMGFAGLIIFPILVAVFGFVGAAIMFVIWKVMGSPENFETVYRCVAYGYAYAPVAALAGGLPYLGVALSVLWPMALMALASIHVHGRKETISWAVFGAIGLVFTLSSMGMEMAGRKMQSGMDNWQHRLEESLEKNAEEMSPEEAGKAVGDFLKGLQQSREN